MKPWLSDPDVDIYVGDALETLRGLPDGSVDCCVTSPPYWGLRDYGTGSWAGGDADCDHVAKRKDHTLDSSSGLGYPVDGGARRIGAENTYHEAYTEKFRDACGKCGATRTDRQLGLEPSPDEYVATMVAVFAEVRRVLADWGTLWLNIGDSYASSPPGNTKTGVEKWSTSGLHGGASEKYAATLDASVSTKRNTVVGDLKPKDLVGIPWMLAKALQAPRYVGRIPREVDRVWLAATIDGEGTICATAHKRKDDGRVRTMPAVFITNSSLAMLAEAQRIWPTSQSDHSRPGAGHLGTADVFRWIVHGIENKTAIVRELYPYLIVKRTQALLAYNLLVLMADAKRLGKSSQAQAVRDKRELICRLISDLNHAKTVDVPSWCVEPPALHEPGWYLRSDIVWSKPNPMPESVTDRPTKSHEFVFLLSKRPSYWFDQEAVREPHSPDGRLKTVHDHGTPNSHPNYDNVGNGNERWPNGGRNVRSVWEIATQPYPDAHFATFPEELPRRCIAAGCPNSVCSVCGKARERLTKVEYENPGNRTTNGPRSLAQRHETAGFEQRLERRAETVGWSDCGHGAYRPGVTLDPFLGSGTTAYVARKLGRRCIGIELSPEYAQLAARRLQQLSLLAEAAP